MPKTREEKGLVKNPKVSCDFCGQHKDDVPLLVVSNTSKVAVCSWCALGVVEQTFKHGMQMENIIREANKPRIEVVPAGEQPDKLDVAIGKALDHGK